MTNRSWMVPSNDCCSGVAFGALEKGYKACNLDNNSCAGGTFPSSETVKYL